MREVFEEVMFLLGPGAWAEMNWVEGTERWREMERVLGRMKSNEDV